MKKFLYMAVAAIAALSSCTNDNDVIGGVPEPTDPTVNAPVFTATIESDAASRTALGINSETGKYTKVVWSNDDKVNVHGAIYTVTPGADASATLSIESGTSPEAIDGKYYAVYPSSIAFDTSTKTITLPATQTYDATTNGIGNVPMVAVSEDTELQFKNICTVLAIKVASGTVKKIKVMADKKNLSGDFTLDPSTSAITATSGENYVVLDCGAGVSADNTTFYIAIPPQEYSSLQIYLSADGTTYKEAMATKKAAGLGPLARNKIFPITYAKNAVQLWADGPYFATMNVGETTVGGNTAKYAWGATTADGAANANADGTGKAYDLDHDTAYKIWGSAWRMPTQGEFEAMSSNCTLSYNSGFIFKGKEGYNSAKVSFPGETVGQSVTAQYWTSSVDGAGNAYHGEFQMNSSGGNTYFYIGGNEPIKSSGTVYNFVRAVLATPAAAPAPTPTPTSNLLPGVFSVSATKKVQFTKGNLYWTGSAYLFEADQTTYPKSWEANHVGHFFWSNYTDYTRTDDKAYTYKPYYSTFAASSKSASDEFWCSEDHKLEVAGTQGLYALSSEEWNYLLNIPYNNNPVGRTQTNRFAKARVNGKAGLLIFPDGYNGTTKLTGITGMCTINEDWDDAYPGESESIPTDTWSAMEAAGVVFLPAAGYRGNPNGQTITPGNCYYWSSTPNSGNVDRANGLSGNGNQFTCPGTIQRNYGSSIRLVKTVE